MKRKLFDLSYLIWICLKMNLFQLLRVLNFLLASRVRGKKGYCYQISDKEKFCF